ncbi:MAG TPA: amidohydrolase family protein [Bryobacteraceae bacterium]|nr:amidohydrolase family protein [Bryobacteraceae bacterium]
MTLKAPALMIMMALPVVAQTPGSYVLQNARVVRVSGPVIERGTVVIRDGLIDAVGENVAAPAGAWVIDCQGLTVYPGLIDALSRWGLPSESEGRGGPPARGPEDRPLNASWTKAADQIVPTDRVIQRVRDAGFTTAVVFPNGNIFSGQGSVIDLAGDRAGRMVVADSVGQYVTLRTSGGRGFPASLLGSIAYVRQIYLDADNYQAAKAIYEKHPQGLPRPAYDRALEGVLAAPLVLLPAEQEIEIARMLTLARDLKRKVVLYGGHEAGRGIDLLKQAQTPVLVSLKFPVKPRDADPAEEEPLRVLEFRDKAPSAAGALAQAGVKFAFYSDGVTNPKDLFRAVRKAVEAGLKADDATRAMTLAPAEIYGVADRLGSIEKGKIANLVVADGDLFAEKTKVKYTFVDGAKFEPLAEEPAQRPAARNSAR